MSEQSAADSAGEVQDTSVVVSRKVSRPVKEVWQVLMTDEGAEALLGPGSKLGSKGHTWTAIDGRSGVIRSFHPMEEIRFSWRRDEASAPSMVALELVSEGDVTNLQVTHSKLAADTDRSWLQDRWTAALERIESDCL